MWRFLKGRGGKRDLGGGREVRALAVGGPAGLRGLLAGRTYHDALGSPPGGPPVGLGVPHSLQFEVVCLSLVPDPISFPHSMAFSSFWPIAVFPISCVCIYASCSSISASSLFHCLETRMSLLAALLCCPATCTLWRGGSLAPS